jgi:hypothetical protein
LFDSDVCLGRNLEVFPESNKPHLRLSITQDPHRD